MKSKAFKWQQIKYWKKKYLKMQKNEWFPILNICMFAVKNVVLFEIEWGSINSNIIYSEISSLKYCHHLMENNILLSDVLYSDIFCMKLSGTFRWKH